MCAKATKEQDKEGFLFTPPRPNVKTCGVVPLLSAKSEDLSPLSSFCSPSLVIHVWKLVPRCRKRSWEEFSVAAAAAASITDSVESLVDLVSTCPPARLPRRPLLPQNLYSTRKRNFHSAQSAAAAAWRDHKNVVYMVIKFAAKTATKSFSHRILDVTSILKPIRGPSILLFVRNSNIAPT